MSNGLTSNVLLPVSPLELKTIQQRYKGAVFRYAGSMSGDRNRIRSEMMLRFAGAPKTEEAHPPSGLSSPESLCEWGPHGGVWGQSLRCAGVS